MYCPATNCPYLCTSSVRRLEPPSHHGGNDNPGHRTLHSSVVFVKNLCRCLSSNSSTMSFTMPVSLWCRRKASYCRPTSYTAARIRRFSYHQMAASIPWPSILPLLYMIHLWPHVPKAPEPPCHLTGASRVSELCLTVFRRRPSHERPANTASRATFLWTPVKVRIRDRTAGLTTWSVVFMSKLAMKAVLYL